MLNIGKMKNTIFLTVLLFSCISPAFPMDVKKYEEMKNNHKSRAALALYIGGIGESYSWSNAIVTLRGDKNLFCPPLKISLNEGNYIDIVDKQVVKMKNTKNKDAKAEEIPIELMMYYGLVEAFPCSN